MAALAVARQLNLVHADELDLPVQGHRLDGADEVAGLLRDSPFFARYQGDGLLPFLFDHTVIDLAGEEAEREAHHPGAMGQHALDRQMGLARVGRAEQSGDRGVFGAVPNHGRKFGAPGQFGKPMERPPGAQRSTIASMSNLAVG